MKKKYCLLLALFCLSLSAWAENQWDHVTMRNEVRIGWGDQLFESLIWHNPTTIPTTMPESMTYLTHENYRYNQHLWAEYQWRFCCWFSLGAMVDVSEVGWDNVVRNGKGVELSYDPNHFFYNTIIMPTMRFTYYHHPYVNLYSGMGFGMDINGGTEKNGEGHKTDVGMAMSVTLIGVSANYSRWFMTVDIGGMTALKDANTIFLACSRIFNVGIGARF